MPECGAPAPGGSHAGERVRPRDGGWGAVLECATSSSRTCVRCTSCVVSEDRWFRGDAGTVRNGVSRAEGVVRPVPVGDTGGSGPGAEPGAKLPEGARAGSPAARWEGASRTGRPQLRCPGLLPLRSLAVRPPDGDRLPALLCRRAHAGWQRLVLCRAVRPRPGTRF